jgi:protein SCO1
MPRRPLLLALALVLVTASACGAQRPKIVSAPPQAQRTFEGTEISPLHTAAPLALRDAAGRRFTLRGQRGRNVLVTFLYTHCPDVCPLIASSLNTVLRGAGKRGNVEVLAVSVDPKGDTAKAVRAYARRMRLDPRFHYLIGSRAELRRAWTAWHVVSVDRAPNLVDHIAYTALVDREGNERVVYDAQVSAEHVLHDLRVLNRVG